MRFLLLPLEFLVDFLFDGWFSIMQWILPKKTFSILVQIILRILIAIYSAILLLIFFFGILCAIVTELTVFDLWKVIFIPLGLGIIQIVIGIIVRCKTKSKNKLDY